MIQRTWIGARKPNYDTKHLGVEPPDPRARQSILGCGNRGRRGLLPTFKLAASRLECESLTSPPDLRRLGATGGHGRSRTGLTLRGPPCRSRGQVIRDGAHIDSQASMPCRAIGGCMRAAPEPEPDPWPTRSARRWTGGLPLRLLPASCRITCSVDAAVPCRPPARSHLPCFCAALTRICIAIITLPLPPPSWLLHGGWMGPDARPLAPARGGRGALQGPLASRVPRMELSPGRC